MGNSRRRIVAVFVAVAAVIGMTAGVAPAFATSTLTATPTPTITGTPKVGLALTAVPGTWAPAPVNLAYKWTVGGTVVSGATASTYTPVAANAGKTVTVTVTGSKSGYTSVSKTSTATAAVAATSAFTTAPTPTITGTPKVGLVLTAVPGTWAPAPVTLTYQWYVGTTAVSGATSTTYTPVAADATKTVKVTVTGTEPGYTTTSKTSAITAAVAAASTLTTTPTPTITGTPRVGLTLTAVPGTWAPAPVTLTYQWYVGTTAVVGATTSTYSPVTADVSKTVKVTVTGSKAGYTSVSETSVTTAAVTATGPFTASPIPTIAGTAMVGSTLTAVPGTWTPAPVTLTYAWSAAGTAISGATSATYVPVVGNVGKTITVTVTGTEAGYTTTSKTSAATAAVASNTVFSSTPTPLIDGYAQSGLQLTVDPGTWLPAPVTLSYAWLANGIAIAGATSPTYTPKDSNVGATLTVTVTGTEPGFTTVSETSAATSAVAPTTPFNYTSYPYITGTAAVGSPLTAASGPWTPAPVALTYAWFANGVEIPGGLGSQYTPVAADQGKAITVEETGTEAGYTTTVTTSDPTDAVAAQQVPASPFLTSVSGVGLGLLVNWVPNDPSDQVTSYTLTATPVAGSTAAGCTTPTTVNLNVLSSSSSAFVSGLCAGVAYTVQGTATNIAGVSASSAASDPTVPLSAQAPDLPLIVEVTPRSGQLTATWTAPDYNGGNAISGYTFTAAAGTSSFSGGAAATADSATLTGLTNGVTYTLTLTANNAIASSSSATTTAIPTAAYVPSTPTTFSAQPDGTGNISVSWQQSDDDGGSAISGYAISYQEVTESAGGVWTPVSGATVHSLNESSTATTASATVFESATASYQFSIVAINGIGNSLPSVADNPVSPTLQQSANTVVLTTATVNALASVTSQGLAWVDPAPTQARSIVVGNVLVAPSAGLLPEGALLAVVAVADDGTTLLVSTTQATLSQAFSNLSTGSVLNPLTGSSSEVPLTKRQVARTPGTFGANGVTFTPASPGISVTPNDFGGDVTLEKSFDLSLNFGPKFGAGCADNASGACLGASVEGKVSVTPSISLGLNVSQNLIGVPNGVSVSASAKVTETGSIQASASGTLKIPLGELTGLPEDIQAGPVPIIIVPKIPLFLNISGSAAVGFTTSITVGGSVSWSSLNPTVLTAKNLSTTPSVVGFPLPKYTATGTAVVGLEAQPQEDIYDAAGPNVEADYDLTANLNFAGTPVLTIVPTLSLKGGLDIDLFGYNQSIEIPIAGTITLPGYTLNNWSGTPTFSISPPNTSVPPGTPITFSATNNGGGAHAVTWSLKGGETGDSITAAGVFTAGPDSNRIVTIIATDSNGIQAQTKIVIGGTYAPPGDIEVSQDAATPFSASLSWTPPSSSEGSPIASYRVVTSPSTGTHVAMGPGFELTGLKQGVYDVTIYAVNNAGAESSPGTTDIEVAEDGTLRQAFASISSTRAGLPAGGSQGTLTGVACPVASGCFAVGSFTNSSGVVEPLIESNLSGTWALMSAPAPSATGGYLQGITCTSATSCVAAGTFGNSSGAYQPFVDILSGSTWTASALPVPADTSSIPAEWFTAGACDGSGGCVLVGSYYYSIPGDSSWEVGLIETLANGVWTASHAPMPAGSVTRPPTGVSPNDYPWALTAVSCSGPGTCAAVGRYQSYTTNGFEGLIENLSGGVWTPLLPWEGEPSYDHQDAGMTGVSCAPGYCLAQGFLHINAGQAEADVPMSDVFSNGVWTPTLPEAEIGTPSCVSAAYCGWAVVSQGSFDPAPAFDSSDNGVISSVTVPAPYGDTASPFGFSCVSPGNCISMATVSDPANPFSRAEIVELQQGGSWTQSEIEVPGDGESGSGGALSSVCDSADNCYIVGDYTDSSSNQAPFIESVVG